MIGAKLHIPRHDLVIVLVLRLESEKPAILPVSEYANGVLAGSRTSYLPWTRIRHFLASRPPASTGFPAPWTALRVRARGTVARG